VNYFWVVGRSKEGSLWVFSWGKWKISLGFFIPGRKGVFMRGGGVIFASFFGGGGEVFIKSGGVPRGGKNVYYEFFGRRGGPEGADWNSLGPREREKKTKAHP